MNILTISGSPHKVSSNSRLLAAIAKADPGHTFLHFDGLINLPLFTPELLDGPLPEAVKGWQAALQQADALVLATPEYIHNIPAVLKNALEWVTRSGELSGMPVLPITFTPHEPRGKRAMQSLLWSLEALDMRIVAQLPLYQAEINQVGEELVLEGETLEMIQAAVELLG